MSNLIITIIAIALTAVVALTGIFYGGTIYQNYLVSSKATETISKLQQVRASALMWMADHPAQGYPTTYATNGTACPLTNQRACWLNALTYNNQYLAMSQQSYTSTLLRAPIIYGQYGVLESLVSFQDGVLGVVSDSATWPNPKWYALWYVSLTNYSNYSTAVSPAEAGVFFIKLCKEINRQLGVPSDLSAYTVNSNTYTGTSEVINLPYFFPNYNSMDQGYDNITPNICGVTFTGATGGSFWINIPIN